MSWQQIKVSTGESVGAPVASLPVFLDGLQNGAGGIALLENLPAYLSAYTISQLGLEDTGFIYVADPPPAAPPASTIMSRIDFLGLMTNQEVADMATSTDANVVAFRYKLTIVAAIDRADPQTIAAIDYMGSMTPPILAAGRGAQILAGESPPAS
ncbi:MAG TPA: hypothetical protein VJP88_04520 [Caulobacteraceae bacterium]|nr:hypothetical protein [Caulobacteraceae bacterium]